MTLICGPCVIENEFLFYETAKNIIKTVFEFTDIDFYFKASCIKDNRTNNKNYTGVGFEKGIEMLLDIKSRYRVNITTDFHTETQIKEYGSKVDLIQIPAFLSMQSSLINEVVKLDKSVHIKKPQFLSPNNIGKPVSKIKDQNSNIEVWVTDRGTMFGYDAVMFDPRHIRKMKELYKADKILIDITHPQNHSKIYDRTYAYDLGISAIVCGVDGLFIESHIDPNQALCDGDSQLYITQLKKYLQSFTELYEFINVKY